MHTGLVRTIVGGVLALVVSALPVSAQAGSIAGQVVNRATNQPLGGAQLLVVGTSIGTIANQQGQFLIRGVPAGEQEVRATLIGYSPQTQRVTVAPGQTARVDFDLAESAIELGAVVVSATGREQTVREIGSSVGVVNVEDVELAPVSTFSNLIQGRTAGAVVLQSSGTTGAGSRIRIRGSNSISLSNAPLLVVDGMRVDSDPSTLSFGTGGQQPSALDDLNPEDIETIEILKGPAASALYGTAAANGVIQVTTKRGRAGQSQIRVWGEGTSLDVSADFPDNVQRLDENGESPCPIDYMAAGFCTPTGPTYRANPLETDSTTVFDGGSRTTYGMSLSGGGEGATFYLSGERSNEESVYNSENYLDKWNLQANLTGQISDKLSVRGNVAWVESNGQFPLSDNALFGAIGMGLYGDADPESVAATGGYENDIAFHYDWKTFQNQSRLISSAAANWAPVTWLSFDGSAGLERITREGRGRIPRESAYEVFGDIYTDGWIQDQDWDIYTINTNLSGSAIANLTPDIVSTTTVGNSYTRETTHWIYSFGATLTPGIEESLAGATTDFEADEGNVLNATLSAYAQQQFAYQDRVFLNGAVRGDQNTAFGTDIGWIWYPSVSAAWVISQENFFPQTTFLDELRLRGAFGQAGLRPGATDALLSFQGGIAALGQMDVPAITINELGNPDLKPERTTEWEFGFESSLLDGRVGLEATYYTKSSRDALVELPLPLSPGGSENRWENLGKVRNSGYELLLNAQLLRLTDVAWNFTVSGSFLDNELVDLGEDAQGNPIPPIGSGTQRFVEGFPLGGWWDQPIQSFDDANADGLISPDEVVVGVKLPDGTIDSDSVAFFGDALPTREFSFSSDVRLWDLFRVSALVDYKGGHKMLDYTHAWRCSYELNCAEAFDENTPLETQAAIVALAFHDTYAGWFEDADFFKLRELSLSFMVPDAWTHYIRASNLTLTVAGRNLATWTDYKGLDPEVAWSGQANFRSGDFATLPPNRMFTVRVDASF